MTLIIVPHPNISQALCENPCIERMQQHESSPKVGMLFNQIHVSRGVLIRLFIRRFFRLICRHKNSEYDQEKPQSQTADKPVASPHRS